MTWWNYRVVRREFKHPNGDIEVQFSIHEAYYEDGEDKATSITEDPVTFNADSVGGLISVLAWAKSALGRPVLDWDDF